MQSILDAINEWIKEILIGAINGNLSTMFGDVNEKVGTIAAEVGQTPQGWNANIFSMIQTLSENVIVPIAGLVITYVLCYELISMVTEKNNMHDVDTSMFFKWVFKAFVAVYLVTHTFDITMAVFDMAQHVVSGAAGVIGGSTEIDVAAALASMQDGLDAMEIPELLLLVMETSLVSLCMKIMSVLITVILYGRMIEIYLYCSVSPIPFATMTNREWGQIGNNYLKSLFAIGFQGFLIMICVGIYAVLVNNMIIADNLHSAIFSLAAYGKSEQLRYIAQSKEPIYPISYVQCKNPMSQRRKVCAYTAAGRSEIHDDLRINTFLLLQLMREPTYSRSTEYADNRISLFSAQWGKCAVTGKKFQCISEIHCHHKKPKGIGGSDKYENLVLVLAPVHELIHAVDEDTIRSYLTALKLDTSQLTKLNKLRTLAKRKPIDLEKPNLTNNSHNGMTKETKKSV